MICHMFLVKSDGTELKPDNLMSFSFEKDAYTPYTRFSAEFSGSSDDLPQDCCGVRLRIDGKTVHFGIADTYRITRSNNYRSGFISSRGYTSMLTENQIPPGLYSEMTIDKLFSSFCSLPNITHESNYESSYIYVKSGSSMWDGIANLSFKLYGRYPYISGSNNVMMSLPESPEILDIESTRIFEYGSITDTRRVVSNFHMQDIEGNYGAYDLSESEAVNRSIVRHRYFDLDRRFLNDPGLACEYRNMLAKSGLKRRFLTYGKYGGEDLYDHVTGGGITDKPILGIRITGNARGIFTRLETEY